MAAVPLRPSWFEEVIRNHENGKKTLLFLDEITTANEFVQAALLHLIFERMVKTEKIPDDTLIVSAGNYAQNLSNTMTLLPPVMNRFMLFNIIPTADDLSVFLNKFDGSMKGERKNYFAELEKNMRELDEQEKDIPEKKYNMIGEYIERGLKDIMKILMTQGDKPVDLTVTDLQNIYSDTEKDSKLYGFITFRTLNYLRDATIAVYQCFGKEGIASNLYRNVIDGLCGIGEFLCDAHGNETGKSLGSAEAGSDSKANLGLSEHSIVGADADITAHSYLISAAKCKTVDCCYNRDRK
jgi:hypothetical protein